MASPITAVLTAWKQASAKQASLLAAGVAFYMFTSLFPALIAGISIYGILTTPETAASQAERLEEVLPAEAASIISGQMDQLVAASASSLGFGAAIAIAIALWSASGGVNNLIIAINQMFSLADDRNVVQKRGLALAMTIGVLVFAILAIGLLAVVPTIANILEVVPGTRYLIEAARWSVLVGLVLGSVGTLYRHAPNRPKPDKFITRGVVLASIAWLAVSAGFTIYVNNFGNYSATYGALAGVVVLLLWLWIGIFAILLGASVQAVNETVVTTELVEHEAMRLQDRTEDERYQRLLVEPLNEFIDELDDVLLTIKINSMTSETAREKARQAQELTRSRKKAAHKEAKRS